MSDESNNDIQLNYEQVLFKQLDRIGNLSSQHIADSEEKVDAFEWSIEVLGAMIPDEIKGSMGNGMKLKTGSPEERVLRSIGLLKKYVNVLAESGKLYKSLEVGELD